MRLLQLGSALVCVLFLTLGATQNRAEAACPEDSLPCDDGGECVKRNEWCDGDTHCQDKSDEAYCKKRSWFVGNPNGCEDTHFLCSDGRCVPLVAKCDGFKDCSDGSDEECEPESTDDHFDYNSSTMKASTEHSISETFSDVSEEEDIPNQTIIPTLVTEPVSDAPIFSSTLHMDIHVGENEEHPTHAPFPASTQEIPLLSSTTPVNYYDKRLEEEAGSQSVFQSPSLSVSSYAPRVTAETVHVPRAHQTQDQRTTTTSSRPLSPTTISSLRSHNSRTTSQPTRSHDSRLPDQWRPPSTHPTRSYVAITEQHPRRDSRHTTQSSNTYDRRRDPYQYQTQPTRSHDSRRYPNYYSTQPTRAHDTRRTHYQYNTQPTRPYEPYRDHYQTRPYDSRRDNYQYQTSSSVPTSYTYYPYQSPRKLTVLATTPGTRYPAVTRVYIDHGVYYGYYDEQGRFIVLRTNGGYRQPTRQPHNVDYRNRQATRNPYPDEERRRQEPTYATPTPIAFTRQLKVPSLFYFSKDLANIYEDKHHSYLRKGKEFILSLRNSTGDWGVETPRALVALSLINNSFANDTYDNNMMQKYFQVFLGSSLLRGDTRTTSLSRLAMAIHGLLATCQNPRDFHGTDLTELVRKQLRSRTSPVNTSVFLALCLANREWTYDELNEVVNRLRAHFTPDEYWKDMLSLSIMALSCHLQQHQYRDSENFRSLESELSNATSKLLDRMLDDGSFGSVYSTALAAQALISVNDSKQWNADRTLDYLKKQQLKDGSFGDFLATYWTLPALSGRSLLHLRNTQCTPPKADRVLTPSEIMAFTGPKQPIRYSLYVGYPNVNGNSIEVLVPRGISFFDIMRVAEHQNSAFKFSYEEENEQIHVYSISNVPNDSERDFQWNLYAKSNTDPEPITLKLHERVSGDIRDFYPRSDDHVIFWYHPSAINS